MCNQAYAMAGGAVLGGISGFQGAKDQARQISEQIAAQNASKVQVVKTMNYDLANLSQEQRDQYDQAVAQLQGNSINSIRNQGMIRAAIGESNLEGRSMDRVLREVEGQDARVADSIRGSYKDSFQGLQQQKEVTVLNADAQIKGMPKINKPSSTSVMLGIASSMMSGASTAGQLYGMGADAGAWGSKGSAGAAGGKTGGK